MNINLNLSWKALFMGMLVVSLLSIGGFWGWRMDKTIKEKDLKISELESVKQDLQASLSTTTLQKNQVEQEKENAVNTGANFYLQAKVLREGIQDLANNFDKLDSLIISDDSRNLKMVNWYYQNASFTVADGTLAIANVKYSEWLDGQNKSDSQYKLIKKDALAKINTLSEALSLIEDLSSKSSASKTPTSLN